MNSESYSFYNVWLIDTSSIRIIILTTLCIPYSHLVIQAQNHPWMQQSQVAPVDAVPVNILSSMQEFQTYNRLKKAALTAVAYHLNNVCVFTPHSISIYQCFINIWSVIDDIITS